MKETLDLLLSIMEEKGLEVLSKENIIQIQEYFSKVNNVELTPYKCEDEEEPRQFVRIVNSVYFKQNGTNPSDVLDFNKVFAEGTILKHLNTGTEIRLSKSIPYGNRGMVHTAKRLNNHNRLIQFRVNDQFEVL